jgi:hypothetical protein
MRGAMTVDAELFGDPCRPNFTRFIGCERECAEALAMPRRRFGVSSALLFSQLVVSSSVGPGRFDPAQCVGNVALLGLRLSGA